MTNMPVEWILVYNGHSVVVDGIEVVGHILQRGKWPRQPMEG